MAEIIKNDELQVYRGEDFIINEKIRIHQPTLGEICNLGEQNYFSFVHNITATPTDLKYFLSLSNIDWNNISEYELFLFIYKMFDINSTKIIFGNELNFALFEPMVQEYNGEIVLYNKYSDITIDRSIYEIIVGYIRKMHNLKKNVERAMNETTKTVLIEEAKEQYEMSKNGKYQSHLLPLISTMTNMVGFKYSWSNVWDMKINAFMDAVQRIQHVENAKLLLSSGYSGFGIDLKKINKKELYYFYRSDES